MKKPTQKMKNKNASLPLIIDCGILSDLQWPGMVSAKGLVNSGATSKSIIDETILKLNNYYVNVHPGAKTRCIDGRHDPKLDEKHLDLISTYASDDVSAVIPYHVVGDNVKFKTKKSSVTQVA